MPNFIARNYSGRTVVAGGTVRVYGSGFSGSTKAWLGDAEAVINDYEDGVIEVSAVSNSGDYTLYLGESSSNKVAIGTVSVIDDVADLHLYMPVRHSKDHVSEMLVGLLPRGFAWYKGKDGFFYKLMSGFAYAVVELYDLVRSFRLNASPSHTESLDEWESELKLPEPGVDFSGSEAEVRRKRLSEIYRKACRRGGCTIPYFKSIIALFGLDAEIYEYWKNPEKFSDVDFGDDDPNFYWMVELAAAEDDWHYCTCNDTCNDYLQWWWNAPVESVLQLIKPAHTMLLFSYTYSGFRRTVYMLTSDGRKILTSEGEYMTASVPFS